MRNRTSGEPDAVLLLGWLIVSTLTVTIRTHALKLFPSVDHVFGLTAATSGALGLLWARRSPIPRWCAVAAVVGMMLAGLWFGPRLAIPQYGCSFLLVVIAVLARRTSLRRQASGLTEPE